MISLFRLALFILNAGSLVSSRTRAVHLHSLSSHDPGPTKIPRILHQSWKESNKLQPRQEVWRQTWIDQNPGWKAIVWSDDDNDKLVSQHYPWLLEIYTSLSGVQRADMVRPLYLHQYGGVYADLDFVALRPVDDLMGRLGAANILLGRDCGNTDDPEKHCPPRQHGLAIPNAFMASTQGHTFWNYVMMNIVREVWIKGPGTPVRGPLETTGPYIIQAALNQYNAQVIDNELASDILILDREIYPYSWTNRYDIGCCYQVKNSTLDLSCCREMFPSSYILTFWSGTWDAGRSEENKQ